MKKLVLVCSILLVAMITACNQDESPVKSWAIGNYYKTENSKEVFVIGISKNGVTMVMDEDGTKKTFNWDLMYDPGMSFKVESCSDDILKIKLSVMGINGNDVSITKRADKFYYKSGADDEFEVIKK